MKINGEVVTILKILKPIIPLLLGAAVVYGTLKQKVDTLTETSNRNTEIVRQINTRLSFIEGALSIKERPFKKQPLGIQNN